MDNKLRPVISALIFGIIVTVVLLFAFSVWITFQDTPQGLVNPLSIFALSAGAFITGLVCTRITRRAGLMYGAVCGLCLSLLVVIAGLVTGSGGVGIPGLFRVVFVMLCTMIGGVLGVNMRKKRR